MIIRGGSHLDCRLLVILVLRQGASPQSKVALVPVLDQTSLLFLEPAGLLGPLHGPGGARGSRTPLSRCHTPGPCWKDSKVQSVQRRRTVWHGQQTCGAPAEHFLLSMNTHSEKVGDTVRAAHGLFLFICVFFLFFFCDELTSCGRWKQAAATFQADRQTIR